MEVLVASALLSLAGGSFYSGLSQVVRMERTIRTTDALYDPFKILWMRSSKDLRNMISLRDHRFSGKQDEMEFPVLGESSRLFYVRYFVKDGNLLRAEGDLPPKFVKEPPRESSLLKNTEWVRFEYAYLDEAEKLLFKPIWMEEPYFGLPRAVKITAKSKTSGKIFSRLISIPQGRWGYVAEEEAKHE